MPVEDWIRRIKTKNKDLPFMGDDVERLTEKTYSKVKLPTKEVNGHNKI